MAADSRTAENRATLEALAVASKAEARELGLVGDDFWRFVWGAVEKAAIELGEHKDPATGRRRRRKRATRSA